MGGIVRRGVCLASTATKGGWPSGVRGRSAGSMDCLPAAAWGWGSAWGAAWDTLRDGSRSEPTDQNPFNVATIKQVPTTVYRPIGETMPAVEWLRLYHPRPTLQLDLPEYKPAPKVEAPKPVAPVIPPSLSTEEVNRILSREARKKESKRQPALALA